MFVMGATALGLLCTGNARNLLVSMEETGHENCENWARRGDCRNNRPFMLANCPDSCHRIKRSIGGFTDEDDVYQDAIQGFAYFLHVGQEEDCMDHVENCESMAQEGKCMENADFMLPSSAQRLVWPVLAHKLS